AHLYEHMAFKGTKQIGTTNYEAEVEHFARIDQLAAELTAERDKGEAADKQKIARLEAELRSEQEAAEQYIIPNEIGKLYERHGGRGLNAQTMRDQTHYFISLPANKIELWMAIESDRMQNTVLRQFYKERDVVMEEVRRTIDTNPLAKLVLQELITAAFRAHPYGLHSGIGWSSDVSHLTRKQTEEFFHRYYGAANATVAIVGDFDTQKIIPMIDRYFGSLPAGRKTPRRITVEPPQEGERRVALESSAQPLVAIAFHRPDVLHPDDIVYDVIAKLLSEGRTSRFYKHLIEGKKIATFAQAFPKPILITGKYPSLFEIIAAPVVPQHTVQELEEAIYEELDRLKTEPVESRELQKILHQVDAQFVRSLRSNATMARLLVFTEALEGDWKRLLTYRRRLAAVTPDDIMRVARQTFRRANRTVAFITAKEKEVEEVAPIPEATPESLTRGRAILDAAIEAIGGRDKITGLHDYLLKGRAKLSFSGQELEGETTQYVQLPDKMRSEVFLPAMGQTIIQILNGEKGWFAQGGRVQEAPPRAIQQLKEALWRNHILTFLTKPDGSPLSAQALPDETIEGTPTDVVLLTVNESKMRLYFDKQTHRLLRAQYQTTHPFTGQKVQAEETYSEYQLYDGFWLARHIVTSYDGEKFSEQSMTEFQANPGLDPSLFQKPE
ncbi:MAG: insulinase family protein, partial [Acidobacteria bacterium]